MLQRSAAGGDWNLRERCKKARRLVTSEAALLRQASRSFCCALITAAFRAIHNASLIA
jgi:hypothetical protein